VNVPDGFLPHSRKSPVTDPWEPLYSRRSEARTELGLVLATPHCNSRGLVHGAVIAALADNAMGLSLYEARVRDLGAEEGRADIVTMTLTIDYLATGRLGDWLQVVPRVLKGGGATGFVDALVTANERLVARASAIFRALKS
jgi:acyl-coenzyme A thioesterase PaaI-like protein